MLRTWWAFCYIEAESQAIDAILHEWLSASVLLWCTDGSLELFNVEEEESMSFEDNVDEFGGVGVPSLPAGLKLAM